MAIPGLDLLGAARYSRTVLEAHPKGWAFGVFLDVEGFGESFALIEKLAASGLVSVFRAHCAWSDSHTYRESDFPTYAKRAKRYDEIARKFPHLGWYVSGACEHKLSSGLANKLARTIKISAPHCKYVNSPMSDERGNLHGALLDGEINEIHGNKTKAPRGQYIVSWDGTPATDNDVEKWKRDYSGALIQFYWDYRFNGHWDNPKKKDKNGKPIPVTPRAKRKGWPDKEFIQSVYYLANVKGPVSKLPERTLWKSHGENHGEDDTKAEEPCLITIHKTKTVALSDVKGGRVHTLHRVDPPMVTSPWSRSVPGYRYYSLTDKGFELAEKARAKTGSPLTKFEIGGRSFTVNPAFREGFYQD